MADKLPHLVHTALRALPCEHCGSTGRGPDHVRVGAVLRNMRLSHGSRIRLRDIADALGVGISYVCDLEAGKRHWNEERARAYLAVLNGGK